MTEMNVLTFSEDRELGLQLLSKGKELAEKTGGELSALAIGAQVPDPQEYLTHGADKVYIAENQAFDIFSVESHKAVALQALETVNPGIILIGATKRGKELAARVAAAVDAGCMTECIDVDLDEEGRLLGERLT